jgi:heme/copper-type cytochrome/quinol oxidase subunit 2
MPIVVEVLPKGEFDAWLSGQKNANRLAAAGNPAERGT